MKRLRKDNRLTQQELADLVKVTRDTVANWENGRTKVTPVLFDGVRAALKRRSELSESLRRRELNRIRYNSKLSQQKFAARVGLTTSVLANLESGRTPVTEDLLERIKDAYDRKTTQEDLIKVFRERREKLLRYLELVKDCERVEDLLRANGTLLRAANELRAAAADALLMREDSKKD